MKIFKNKTHKQWGNYNLTVFSKANLKYDQGTGRDQALVAKPDSCAQSSDPTWQERKNKSFDIHTHRGFCMPTLIYSQLCTHTYTHIKQM